MGKGILDYLGPISGAVNAVSGAVGLIDTLTGGADARAKKMAQYQFDLNEKAAQNAYGRQVDFWNMQNEYNTPVNQMARYQEASINPNAVFGQVSGNAASGSSAPQAAPADVAAAQTAQYQKQALALQAARQIAETRLIDAQAKNINADTSNKEADTDLKEQELPWIDKLHSVEWNATDAQAFKTDAETNYLRRQLTMCDDLVTQIRTNIELMRSQISNITQDTLNKFQQYLQNDKSFEKLLKNMDMDINLKGAQIAHLRAQCALVYSQVTGQDLSNSYQRQINAFGAKTFNDKVSMYRLQRGLFDIDYQSKKVQLPSLLKLGAINNYLYTTNEAINVVRNGIGISSDFLDNAKKPMSFGTDFINGVTSMGGKFVP